MKCPYYWSKHTCWTKTDRIFIEAVHQCIIECLSVRALSYTTLKDTWFTIYYHRLNSLYACKDTHGGTYVHRRECPSLSSKSPPNKSDITDQTSPFLISKDWISFFPIQLVSVQIKGTSFILNNPTLSFSISPLGKVSFRLFIKDSIQLN